MNRLTVTALAAAAAVTAFAAPADKPKVVIAPTEDVAVLTENFGREGRVSFEKGESGYPVATLACKDGVAKVSLLGGNVFSYVPEGQKDVLYHPTHLPFVPNGDKFVHGGIPVCWPWFNCFDFPGRPLHGFARYSLWEVRKVTVTDDFTEMVIGMKTTPETKKLWPYDADLQLTVRVSTFLDLILKTRNTGKAEFALTEGLHAYFWVEDEEKAVLKGFKNAYWDTLSPNCKFVHFGKDEIALTRGEGRVWGWAPFTTTIVDPVLKRTVNVSSYGKKRLILWNTAGDDASENLDEAAGRNFICIEPSTIPHEDAWIVPPGRSHELMLSVQSKMD